MDLNFDIRGNLKPYEKIELDPIEFKTFFVDDFAGRSKTRETLFESYLAYLNAFREEVSTTFVHWIDGSFVSNKRNPGDIDLVTLLDYETYEKKEALIEDKYRGEKAQTKFGKIDAYFVKVYPKDHDRYFITEYDLVYWRSWFTETKKNRARKKFKKGFVEIRFDNQTVQK